MGKAPSSAYPHALRWYNHIKSFGSETSKFPGVKGSAAAAAPAKPADDDDDDVDLFGDDDEVCFFNYIWLNKYIVDKFFTG